MTLLELNALVGRIVVLGDDNEGVILNACRVKDYKWAFNKKYHKACKELVYDFELFANDVLVVFKYQDDNDTEIYSLGKGGVEFI